MTARRARVTVDSVLQYLSLQKQAAEMGSQRCAVLALSAAWLLVHDGFYGRVLSPKPSMPPVQYEDRRAEMRAKAWFREKYAKPLRLVVREVERFERPADGGKAVCWYDQVLTCGHVIHGNYDCPGVVRAKRRRCAECAPVELPEPVPAEKMLVM